MLQVLVRATLIFLLCTALAAGAYFLFDWMANISNMPKLRLFWVLILPVYGVFFSYLFWELGAETYHALRSAAIKPLNGQYYQYMSWRLHILEDDDRCRWVATDEVRCIVGHLASDQALAQIYPTGHQYMGKKQGGYLRDDVLLTHLAQATTPQAIRFKNWAERNIAFPARTQRQRLGIRINGC
jgi:hypothetical protein